MKVDPDAAGMDAARLRRIDEHLRTRYLEPGKLAGCQVVVSRFGEVVHASSLGLRDREREQPVGHDTVWRIYSMTKPVVAVALLTLYERGMFQLTDPVHRFIPSFRDVRVKERLDDGSSRLVPPDRPMQVRDALMHMAGLGYGPPGHRFDLSMLLREGPAGRAGAGATLETFVDRLADQPLVAQPGARWLYAWSIDVCARVVEVLSGRRLDEYLQEEIFGPLGMVDTGFAIPDASVERFASCYTRGPDKRLVLVDDARDSWYREYPTFLSGSGGLLSTSGDYLRFCHMLLHGGELEGTRILSRKTVELMRTDHLPAGVELGDLVAPGTYGEVGFDGMGFGLTVAVSRGPTATGVVGSTGEYSWGGAASTVFWIDPVEQIVCLFLTQLIPSGTFDFRGQLKALVYGALAD
jgi:CubicO group peptidase (beta-lactamase class C family)